MITETKYIHGVSWKTNLAIQFTSKFLSPFYFVYCTLHGLQAKKPDDDPRDMVRARKLASDDFRQPFDANIRDDSFSR